MPTGNITMHIPAQRQAAKVNSGAKMPKPSAEGAGLSPQTTFEQALRDTRKASEETEAAADEVTKNEGPAKARLARSRKSRAKRGDGDKPQGEENPQNTEAGDAAANTGVPADPESPQAPNAAAVMTSAEAMQTTERSAQTDVTPVQADPLTAVQSQSLDPAGAQRSIAATPLLVADGSVSHEASQTAGGGMVRESVSRPSPEIEALLVGSQRRDATTSPPPDLDAIAVTPASESAELDLPAEREAASTTETGRVVLSEMRSGSTDDLATSPRAPAVLPVRAQSLPILDSPRSQPIEPQADTESPAPAPATPGNIPAFQALVRELIAPDEAIAQPQAAPSETDDLLEAPVSLPGSADPPMQKADSAQTTPVAQPAPEARFAEGNHDRIITAIRSELLPHGGTMQLRLDPPELGALAVRIELRDGAITAAFQTSNDEATRLLSHSLGQLRHALESQGVSVERLQVERAPQSDHSRQSSDDPSQQQQHQEQSAQQQEQERRELLQRMWRKLSGAADPLDVTA